MGIGRRLPYFPLKTDTLMVPFGTGERPKYKALSSASRRFRLTVTLDFFKKKSTLSHSDSIRSWLSWWWRSLHDDAALTLRTKQCRKKFNEASNNKTCPVNWFRTHGLNGRKQRARLNGQLSDENFGVCQGSALRPEMFNLSINVLEPAVNSGAKTVNDNSYSGWWKQK